MKKMFFLAAIIAVSMAACKKDKDATPGQGNGGETSQLLKKMIKTEAGVVTTYTFSYDAAKRVTSVTSSDNNESTQFFYDAGGNLVKVEETDSEFRNIYTYSYTGGIPVSGSFKSWQKTAGEPDEMIEDDVLSYSVANDQVTAIKLHFNMSEQDDVNFEMTYSNGNLSKVKTVGNEFYTATFTFGAKKPVYPVISKYVLDQAGFSLQFAAKNELLSAHFDFPGTEMDKTITTQYTYDSKGYVLTSNDGEAHLKFEYQ
jgi:YD repeat-containing protein